MIDLLAVLLLFRATVLDYDGRAVAWPAPDVAQAAPEAHRRPAFTCETVTRITGQEGAYVESEPVTVCRPV